MFALVLGVILLVWARASLVVFALFYTHDMPSVEGFLAQMFSFDNLEFLFAYFCVGGFFAVLVFAISVVSVPMMLDRDTDGIVAVLTSLRAFGGNVPAMMSVGSASSPWSSARDSRSGSSASSSRCRSSATATWHAYRDIVA